MLLLCSERLKNERKKAKLTQQKLALLLEVSDMTIKRWETGVTAVPSDKLILMKNLGFDVSYILFGESDNSLSSDEAFILERIRQVGLETRNKILMLLLGSGEMLTSGVNNQDNVVHGQQNGNNNEQSNSFDSGSLADQNIHGDVKIKSKGKRSQAAFNISNNEK